MEETKEILREIRDHLDNQGAAQEALVKQIAAVRPAEAAWKGYIASAAIALVPMMAVGFIAWGQLTTTQASNTDKIIAIDKHLSATDAQLFTLQRLVDAIGYKLDKVQGDADKATGVIIQLTKDVQELRVASADIGRMRSDFQEAAGIRTQQLADLNTQLGQVAKGLDENNSNTRLLSERLENMRAELGAMFGVQLPGASTPVMPPATPAIPPRHFNIPLGNGKGDG